MAVKYYFQKSYLRIGFQRVGINSRLWVRFVPL